MKRRFHDVSMIKEIIAYPDIAQNIYISASDSKIDELTVSGLRGTTLKVYIVATYTPITNY
jgi:hypothetical protein